MISICMAYYNRRLQLMKTLQSIGQYNEDVEIIIVDDGSDPNHALDVEAMELYAGCQVKLLVIDDKYDTLVCWNRRPPYWSIGIIGGKKRNPFYKHVLVKSMNNSVVRSYQALGNELLNDRTLAYYEKRFPELNFFNLPMDWYYRAKGGKKGQHWYSGNKMVAQCEALINPGNYKVFYNVLSRKLVEVLEDKP